MTRLMLGPEPLKHDLSGEWSRRIIDDYRVENEIIYIYSAKDHY